MSATTTKVSRLANVVIPVADSDRALAFYTETVGLEQRVDIPFGGQYRWIEVAPAGAETSIALAPPPAGGESGNKQTGISLLTDDIESYHALLKGRGVDVDAEISRMGDPIPPMFWFRDPEGNVLLVIENR